MKAVHVLYIAGWGRSGTTLMGNILGQIPGFAAVGELRFFWERNLVGNHPCGCGSSVRNCTFWKRVLKRAWDGDPPPPEEMIRWGDHLRTRHLPMFCIPGSTRYFSRVLTPYLNELSKFYRAIEGAGEARVIVDISKYPSYAYALSLLPEVELSLLLMVRDPRAVAYSWLHPKIQQEGQDSRMKRIGCVTSSALWTSWSLSGEWLGRRRARRFALVRYEDFATNPRAAVEQVLAWLGEPAGQLPFNEDETVRVRPTHTTSGNPDRMATGRISIRLDDRWRSGLPARKKALVTSICWPLMRRYGYLGPWSELRFGLAPSQDGGARVSRGS